MGRRAGAWVKTVERNRQIRAQRATGETLEAIGQEWGLSKQRVAQICEGVEPGPRPVRYPIKGFRKAMREWVRAAGYQNCTRCQVWFERGEFTEAGVRSPCRRCRGCNAELKRESYPRYAGREVGEKERAQRKAAWVRYRDRRKAGLPVYTREERRQIQAAAARKRRQEAK